MRVNNTLLLISLILGMVGTCLAADFPEKTVNYIIPFATGGESDIIAKLQLEKLEKVLGQNVEIVYKPGGGGAKGWAEVTNSAPDGYAITGCNLPHIIIQPIENARVGYKTEDINIVYIFNSTPDILVVAKDSPFNSLKDLIKYAKANPGSVTIGGSSSFSANHLGVIELGQAVGVKFTYVPYSGSGTALPALLNHNVTALMTYPTMALNNPKDVKVLAVATEKRMKYWRKAPTFKELGYKIVEGAYRGVAVPPGTPLKVMKVLEAAFDKVARDPELQRAMEEQGLKVEYYGIEASQKLVASKVKYYQGLLVDLGLK